MGRYMGRMRRMGQIGEWDGGTMYETDRTSHPPICPICLICPIRRPICQRTRNHRLRVRILAPAANKLTGCSALLRTP